MKTLSRHGSPAGSGHWLNACAIASSASRLGGDHDKEFQMADGIESHLDGQIDRYVRGELSPAEARALAQKCLDDPELFEDLTSVALTKSALDSPSIRKRLKLQNSGARAVRFPRVWAAVAAAVAAAV